MAEKVTAASVAAIKRERRLVSLADERAKLVAAGKDARVKQVDAEIARCGGKPVGRSAPPSA